MTREEKGQIVQQLSDELGNCTHFYLTDVSGMTVAENTQLRRKLFDKGLSIRVVKNTLLLKAFEGHEGKFDGLNELMTGNTALVFTETANLPAKVISEFRKKNERPLLKGAFIDSDFFIGDEQLKVLADMKSKEELIGEIIGLLQSPAKNVISALQSGGGKLAGILSTLSERQEN